MWRHTTLCILDGYGKFNNGVLENIFGCFYGNKLRLVLATLPLKKM